MICVTRAARLVVPGFPHHVTQRGVRGQPTFLDHRDYECYLRLAHELSSSHDIEFWAYCLMPNHIHAVVVPGRDDSLGKFFKALHQRYARLTNLKYDWQGHLWQARFFSVVLNELHALTALRYVELNPVRAGIVLSPEEWTWSSARGNLGLGDDALVNRSSTQDLVPDWRSYLNQPEIDADLKGLRRQTLTGKPDLSKPVSDTVTDTRGAI